MKAVILGGAGFLGSHVADALSARGYEVVIFDRVPSPYATADQKVVLGDICDERAVQDVVAGADYIYHFAGFADLDDASSKPLETIKQNILGTAVVLEAADRAKISRFVYASTVYVYSTLGGFYRCSKQAAELYVEEYQRRGALDFTILRYGTLYGPRADNRNSVWRYLHLALTERRIVFPGKGDEIREYVHARDAALLSVDILAPEFRNQHVIITGHHPTSARDMLNMIGEILNNGVRIEFDGGGGGAHYTQTPYSFLPRIGNKLVSNRYVDMGQGLLECLHEMSEQQPEK